MLSKCWGVNPAKGTKLWNPAPLPECFTRPHLDAITSEEWWVTVKTDGLRCQLFLTTDERSKLSKAYLVTRDCNFHEISVTARQIHFDKQCLLDGELTWQTTEQITRLVFFAFDTIVLDGENLMTTPLCVRALRAADLLNLEGSEEVQLKEMEVEPARLLMYARSKSLTDDKIVPAINPHGLTLAAKTHLPRSKILQLPTILPTGVGCDGLVFTSLGDPGVGRTSRVLKWKPNPTIDVMVGCGDGTGTIYVTDRGKTIEANKALIAHHRHECLCLTAQHNVLLEWAQEQQAPSIMECSLEHDHGTFFLFPLTRRLDKTTPNSVTTVLSTLHRVIENVTIDEIAVKCVKRNASPLPNHL